MTRKKVVRISLTGESAELWDRLIKEAHMESFPTAFVISLLVDRESARTRKVGRPRKHDQGLDESEECIYPAPDGGTSLYTRDEWEAYYTYRNLPVPPIPRPVK